MKEIDKNGEGPGKHRKRKVIRMGRRNHSDSKPDVFRFASQYSFTELALQIAAFHFYNNMPAYLLPCPRTLRLLVDRAGVAGNRKVTSNVTQRILGGIQGEYGPAQRAEALSREQRTEEARPASERGIVDVVSEETSMGEAAQDISNPGTPGQMLVYSLERYGPHSDLLAKYFGFSIEDLCRTVRMVHFRIEQILGPLIAERTADLTRSGRTSPGRRLDTPPRRFLEAYQRAVVFTSDDIQGLEEHVGAKGCIEFLTEVPAHFSSRNDSFARWAFASRPEGRSQLLVPWTLAETATSSVHLALLSKLDPREKGAYGRALGSRFEILVGDLFRRHWPGIRIEARKRFQGQLGDTDLLVEIDGNVWVLIQCKGRALRPEGRWGRQITYKADFDRNVSEAAAQAREALAAVGNERRVVSVFIVLDAYFAGVTAYSHASGAVERALHGLPKPLVLVYYDLDYLLRHVGRDVLFSFLEWRETLLRTGRFYLTDEFDVVRLYLRRSEFPPGLFERVEFNLNFIGFDRDFVALTLSELDARLFPGGP